MCSNVPIVGLGVCKFTICGIVFQCFFFFCSTKGGGGGGQMCSAGERRGYNKSFGWG